MDTTLANRSIYRALPTVNAPLPRAIDADTLLECLLLRNTETQWRPHVRGFFEDVSIDVMMDMVVDGAVSFDDLLRAMSYWEVEVTESAGWIREMAPISVAEVDVANAPSDRLGVIRG
jgi:hypothetical protein